MPRHARLLTEKNTYHVMLRGNNKEKIFIDDEDKSRMINTIVDKKVNKAFYLYAYCVMDNHLHIIIKEGTDNLSRAMKRLATSYAYYFNKKYRKIGHVFQDRYRSECIDDHQYLMTAIRYIHQNPEKAGIGTIENYKWSSYKSYIKSDNTIVNIEEILDNISNDKASAVRKFARFSHEKADEIFIDVGEERQINEENVQAFISQYLSKQGILIEELRLEKNNIKCEELIKILSKDSNLSGRGIAHLIGLNREKVRKLLSREPSP